MADQDEDQKVIDTGYPFGQLLKSLRSTSDKAQQRVEQWRQVIAGIMDGSLAIGSRTPVGNTPPWVTLDVVHGGLATGGYAAGGKLKPHEIEKFSTLNTGTTRAFDKEATVRSALNLYYNSESGRQELSEMLGSGHFRAEVPEECALLTAAWLAKNGNENGAESLLDTLAPYFNQLRFYPVPASRPIRIDGGVHIATAGECADKLRKKKPNERILQMIEVFTVWNPLFDRAVGLFLETVDDAPSFKTDANGDFARAPNGQPILIGGWPCKKYAENWSERARALLADYKHAVESHKFATKHRKRKENFSQLFNYLEVAAKDPSKLTGRDVGMIRKILAACSSRHGLPGSDRLKSTREMQEHQSRQPLHHHIAHAVASRLAEYPSDDGITEVDVNRVVAPVTPSEAVSFGLVAGNDLPPALRATVMRCLDAPLDILIQQKLVPSAEIMAKLLPSITGSIRAKSIADPELARVFAAGYSAFRQRRTLLLLNLSSQVRLEELPWVAAVSSYTGADEAGRAAAREALTQAACAAFTVWPQTITPNDLVKEMRMLAKTADLSMPLVDELAADIFMGTFALNFLRAAQKAGRLLRGSLYERYYGLDYEKVLRMDSTESPAAKSKARTSPEFDEMCMALASQTKGRSFSVAGNGTIIEQAQILTTHNLAALFNALELKVALEPQLEKQAQDCFSWICRRLQTKFADWRPELQAIKNAAYAWRQMLFFISLLDQTHQERFVSWCEEYLSQQTEDFRRRFYPVVQGLDLCVKGQDLPRDGWHPSGARRFLGWTAGERHWLRNSAGTDNFIG